MLVQTQQNVCLKQTENILNIVECQSWLCLTNSKGSTLG